MWWRDRLCVSLPDVEFATISGMGINKASQLDMFGGAPVVTQASKRKGAVSKPPQKPLKVAMDRCGDAGRLFCWRQDDEVDRSTNGIGSPVTLIVCVERTANLKVVKGPLVVSRLALAA